MRIHRHLKTILSTSLFLVVACAVEQRRADAAEPLRPTRVETPPVIDGRLDDDIWQRASKVSGFKTWRPDYGKSPGGDTIVYTAYDAENMYFAFRAFDPEPSKIKASMASRDTIRPDDWICINLDSFNDQQSLYAFYVNPFGIQSDSRFASNKEDFGFDAVWYSAGRVDDQGYSIEVRIPFKSIRYGRGAVVQMGVILERNVSRNSEGSTFPALDPRAGFNFTIQTVPMAFERIKHYTLFEVLPDATYSRQHQAQQGALVRTSARGDLGLTGKFGVTPQLTLDGTYNPDFSQVEADAGQVDINLRHPLFFAEKRPFFLEGNEVFNLAGPQNGALESVVHTRTIVNPVAGVKMSGKLARADTLAALYAVDEGLAEDPAGNAQVSILRYKRSLRQDGYLGGFYVGREQGERANRVGGADGTVRLDQSSSIGFHAFASHTRHDDGRAERGHAAGVDFSHDTRRLSLYAAGADVSTGFQAESGYLPRNGVSQLLGSAALKLYPGSKAVRRVTLTGTSHQTRDAFSGIWETFNAALAGVLLPRATSLVVNCHGATEVFLSKEFDTSGCTLSGSSQLRKELRLTGSLDRGNAIYYVSSPFGGRSTRASFTLVYQPSDQWSETLSFTYANLDPADGAPRLYDYGIVRSRTTYQLNRYLFFRGIAEYNSYRRQLVTDFLGSFTYIPGTVLHAGYGSLYERVRWEGTGYVRDRSLLETRRGLFLKASYLWRL